jgi:hypothetical protein
MRLVLAALALGLLCSGCATTGNRELTHLRQQLSERDAEIAALKAQLASQAKTAAQPEQAAPASTTENARQSAGAAESTTSPAPEGASEQEEVRALEEALVRRGTQVLPRGQVQIEPELSYAYSDNHDLRRDTFGGALTALMGLPWASQIDVRVPVVISDRLERNGATSGLGDISIGLSKELLARDGQSMGLVASARWYTDTGR